MALHYVETKHTRLEQEKALQLLPGILEEIFVDLIVAKFLAWREICILSLESHDCWASHSKLQGVQT